MLEGAAWDSLAESRCEAAGETPANWEENLSPSSLSSEDLECLTEKVGTLGLQSTRKNRCGAAKKHAWKAKLAEARTGDSGGGQPQPSQGI